MAASTMKMNGPWGRTALALVLSILLLQDGAVCQETTEAPDGAADSPETTVAVATTATPALTSTEKSPEDSPTTHTLTAAPDPTPDDVADQTTDAPAIPDTTQTPTESTTAPETGSTLATTLEATTDSQQTTETVTSVPATDQVTSAGTMMPTDTQTPEQTPESTTMLQTMTASTTPVIIIEPFIQCVDKEAVSKKDAVKLKLEVASSCEVTKEKMEEIAQTLCENDCKLKIFQEENSSIAIVGGPNIQDNAMAMADKFNSEPIKDKLGLMQATPHWGEQPQTVLAVLVTCGLLLAALLIGGYCLKERHRRRAKGMRLAEESYQADEENQGNTLVSVAPLTPPGPQEKPSVNGESPKGAKIEPPPAATNGHSTAKAPVADTEL